MRYDKFFTRELLSFITYVESFYAKGRGIYPIATELEIHTAIVELMETYPIDKIEFDSLDRERVRAIIGR